jgi:hypothetical protein
MLSESHIQRYQRQILLRGFGGRGQERLLSVRVLSPHQNEAVAVARAYLLAGGTAVSGAGPAAFGQALQVESNPDAGWTAPVGAALVANWEETSADGVAWSHWPHGVVCVSPEALSWKCSASAFAAATVPVAEGAVENALLFGALAALVLQQLLIGTRSGCGQARLVDGRLQFDHWQNAR